MLFFFGCSTCCLWLSEIQPFQGDLALGLSWTRICTSMFFTHFGSVSAIIYSNNVFRFIFSPLCMSAIRYRLNHFLWYDSSLSLCSFFPFSVFSLVLWHQVTSSSSPLLSFVTFIWLLSLSSENLFSDIVVSVLYFPFFLSWSFLFPCCDFLLFPSLSTYLYIIKESYQSSFKFFFLVFLNLGHPKVDLSPFTLGRIFLFKIFAFWAILGCILDIVNVESWRLCILFSQSSECYFFLLQHTANAAGLELRASSLRTGLLFVSDIV